MQLNRFYSLNSVIARVDMEVYSPKQINYHTNAINLDYVLYYVHLIVDQSFPSPAPVLIYKQKTDLHEPPRLSPLYFQLVPASPSNWRSFKKQKSSSWGMVARSGFL